ncbi:gup1 [Symbiodinium microadriaticum]|nr:gup1 [Symbiodinium microadriaticum]
MLSCFFVLYVCLACKAHMVFLVSDSRSLRHGGHTLVLAALACGSFGIAKACGCVQSLKLWMQGPSRPSRSIQRGMGYRGYADVTAVTTEEIPLDEDLLGSFCRRGRRRLRELQEATQTIVRLDRARGCLSVSCISVVKRHLASLGGPRRDVAAPVWAELMRTRTLQRDDAALARIQAESGCRVHIERQQREVRLFGPVDSVALAESLLKELEEGCCEDVVLESLDTETDLETLQASLEPLAMDHNVTLCIEKSHGLRVFGLKAAVKAASSELKELLEPDGGVLALEHRLKGRTLRNSESERIGVVLTQMPPERAPQTQTGGPQDASGASGASKPQTGPRANQSDLHGSVSLGHVGQFMGTRRGDRCPTCGCGRFCGVCGSEIWQFRVLAPAPVQVQSMTGASRGAPVAAWAFGLLLLAIKALEVPVPVLDPWLRGLPTAYDWHQSLHFLSLKLISFNMDYFWALQDRQELEPTQDPEAQCQGHVLSELQKREKSRPLHEYSIFNLMTYFLYSPLWLAGPTTTFNSFMSHLHDRPQQAMSAWQLLLYALRLALCLGLLEALLCCTPVWAIGRSSTYLQLHGRADLLVAYAILLLIVMWLKFLCIWRFARLWALCDGIDVPENMQRCVCNNYSLSGFWRGWHSSFNLWLVRYLYIPLGGRRWLWANVWVVFGFVALWHDLEAKLFAWGFLNAAFMVLEHLASVVWRSKAAALPAEASRWFRAAAGALYIYVLFFVNLVGYALGITGTLGLLHLAFGDAPSTALPLLMCTGLLALSMVQVMLELRESGFSRLGKVT